MLLQKRIGREIRMVDNLLRRQCEKELKQFLGKDVTVIHLWILNYIVDSEPGIVFQKDVEKEFEIAKSTATSTLKLMEKKGLITRETDPADERFKKLCITDKGRQITKEFYERAKQADRQLIKGIDEERLNIFYSVLDEIKKNAM